MSLHRVERNTESKFCNIKAICHRIFNISCTVFVLLIILTCTLWCNKQNCTGTIRNHLKYDHKTCLCNKILFASVSLPFLMEVDSKVNVSFYLTATHQCRKYIQINDLLVASLHFLYFQAS